MHCLCVGLVERLEEDRRPCGRKGREMKKLPLLLIVLLGLAHFITISTGEEEGEEGLGSSLRLTLTPSCISKAELA